MVYGFAAEEYLLLLETLGDFMEKEIEPTAREIDLKARFPTENMTKLFEQGFTSMSFPKEYGGLELPWPIYASAMEMCGKACAYSVLPNRRKSTFHLLLRVRRLLRSRSQSPELDRMPGTCAHRHG